MVATRGALEAVRPPGDRKKAFTVRCPVEIAAKTRAATLIMLDFMTVRVYVVILWVKGFATLSKTPSAG